MPFPEVPRAIYKQNPLQQVICQLRFPPILKIDADVPADFQEKIRNEFPNYSQTVGLNLEVPQQISEQPIPPELLRNLFQTTTIKNYEFSSEDGKWKVNLTHTFIALTNTEYQNWESYKERMLKLFEILLNIYSPAHFSRIGLRYINVIKRS